MSEYQYYEFQAIDRPLDEQAMAALRSITSRARITPTSLVNVYHFGDFKGNPDRLIDQYFDAHLYFANWGTRRLMLRLPARCFDLAAAQPYCIPDVLKTRATGTHVVFDFHLDIEGGDDFEEGEGWLASLLSLRSDLLAGDLRCLYLGWLSGVESGAVDEDTSEPPVPDGLQQLSASLRRLADFLRLDPGLVEAAAVNSEREALTDPAGAELACWIVKLPGPEKDSFLLRLMQGEAVHLAGELLQRFRKDQVRVGRASLEQALDSGKRQPSGQSDRSRRPVTFTHRQGQFLAFIHLYHKLHRQAPAETDMVRFFRVTPRSLHEMVVKLADLGLITREPGVVRSIRVTIPRGRIPELEHVAGPPW